MKIAIIGSGISGMSCAYLLSQKHDIKVFEKETRIGGHSRTLEIDYNGKKIAVDTGFIVFNYKNYPHLSALFSLLDVAVQKSNMSFGITADEGFLEYSAENISTLFAQKKNLLRPQFYKMLFDINKFFKQAKKTLRSRRDITLQDLLDEMNLGDWFKNYFILPMAAAIWSCPLGKILDFPAATFVTFFENHGLLTIANQPQWYTVCGGSINYIKKLTANFQDKIICDAGVKKIVRGENNVEIFYKNGSEIFDKIIFACHADDALALLDEPLQNEKEILSSFKFQENIAYLHNDLSIMPKNKKCFASWIYKVCHLESKNVDISYNMNKLQKIDENFPLFVTLNPIKKPREEKIFNKHVFYHPIFDLKAIEAQEKIAEIQGLKNSYYCGAWQRYGFHEDGILSAVKVAKLFNIETPWKI